MGKTCPIHGETEFLGGVRPRCKRCNVEAVAKRRLKLKEMAVAYKGGACERCGYDRCSAALHFHHRDPSTKSFGISAHGQTRSWERVMKELDKCEMVCANCHAEIHAGVETAG